MISELEETFRKEIEIWSRNYSIFRFPNPKWRLKPIFSHEKPKLPIHFSSYHHKSLSVISCELKPSQSETLESLQNRLEIKRSPKIFFSIMKYWKLVNPLNLPGIPKESYIKLYTYIYSETKEIDKIPNLVSTSIEEDWLIDSSEQDFLGFTEFYNGFFAFLDSRTKSKLENEYIRLLRSHFNLFQKSSNFHSLKAYARSHIENKEIKHSYENWMKVYLGRSVNEYEKMMILRRPSFISRNECQPKLNSRLFMKSMRSIKAKEDLESARINKMKLFAETISNEKIKKRSVFEKALINSHETKKVKSKPYFRTNLFLEKCNPISTFKTHSRKRSSLLEEIMKTRRDLENN